MSNALFVIQYFSSLFMTGLIWLVQMTHYPYFFYTSDKEFVHAQSFHMRSISYVVMPIMVIELISAIYLLIEPEFKLIKLEIIIAFILLILIWITTYFLSVPLHEKLLEGKDISHIDKLVISNWWRTILWTLKSLILSYGVFKILNLIYY